MHKKNKLYNWRALLYSTIWFKDAPEDVSLDGYRIDNVIHYTDFVISIYFGIVIAYWEIPRFSQIGLLLTFALSKMACVAYVFMHLYYEKKIIRRILVVPIPFLIFFLLSLAYDATFTWTIQ